MILLIVTGLFVWMCLYTFDKYIKSEWADRIISHFIISGLLYSILIFVYTFFVCPFLNQREISEEYFLEKSPKIFITDTGRVEYFVSYNNQNKCYTVDITEANYNKFVITDHRSGYDFITWPLKSWCLKADSYKLYLTPETINNLTIINESNRNDNL